MSIMQTFIAMIDIFHQMGGKCSEIYLTVIYISQKEKLEEWGANPLPSDYETDVLTIWLKMHRLPAKQLAAYAPPSLSERLCPHSHNNIN